MEFNSEFKFESLNKLFEKSFKENWDRPALSNYKGATLAYRDVAMRIAMLHVAFRVCGLRKGDKVAICARNQANWGVVFLSALTYGAVAVPILHEFKAGNIHYLVNHSDAAVLFTDEAIWENLQESEMPRLAAAVQINNFKLLSSRSNRITRTREHFNELFGRTYPNEFTPDDIHRAIMQLPTGYRTVLNLYVFEDKSHKEIAQILGIKESSSASQLNRAKKMIRNILDNQ